MATITLEIALELIKNNGCYMDDPQAYAILRYSNMWTGGPSWAVTYNKQDLKRYYPSGAVFFPEVVWPVGGPTDIDGFIEWREKHVN